LTLGLDAGYDAGAFNQSSGFSSRLLEQDCGIGLGIILLMIQEGGMQIRILQSRITGTAVYKER